jgi:hypothetical protein
MEGESSGVQQAQGQAEQGENQQQGGQEPGVDAQVGQKQDQQETQKDAVSGGRGTDYDAQLKAKDAEIEALQTKVAEAAKTAEATERLGKEIADLKARLADEGKEGLDMPNNIAAIKNYTTILDRVYQREATSSCLNSPARMARAGRNAKEIIIPKISVSGLGD